MARSEDSRQELGTQTMASFTHRDAGRGSAAGTQRGPCGRPPDDQQDDQRDREKARQWDGDLHDVNPLMWRPGAFDPASGIPVGHMPLAFEPVYVLDRVGPEMQGLTRLSWARARSSS